jgi:hypothetical protein
MYWPEFAAAGKSSITISHVLSHAWAMQSLDGGSLSLPQAIEGTFDGSCEVRVVAFIVNCHLLCSCYRLSFGPSSQVLRRIAASQPSHPAGTCSGYHGAGLRCSSDVQSASLPVHCLSHLTDHFLCSPRLGHSGGYVVGEIIRRATGSTIRDFVCKELAATLGVEFYFGIPTGSVRSRVSKVMVAAAAQHLCFALSCSSVPPANAHVTFFQVQLGLA